MWIKNSNEALLFSATILNAFKNVLPFILTLLTFAVAINETDEELE